jgi:cytochrome c2
MKRLIVGLMALSPLLLLGIPAAGQDVRRGEHVFRKCLLCHVTQPNAKDLVAPPLHNIMGRKAAVISGFDYSDIMKTAGKEGLVWNQEALYYFLDRPEEFMPGTYMAFSGLDEQERRDVIAYLERVTAEWKRNEARQGRPTSATPPSPQKAAQPAGQPKAGQPRP